MCLFTAANVVRLNIRVIIVLLVLQSDEEAFHSREK